MISCRGSRALLPCVVGLMLLGGSGRAVASEQDECSLETLQGDYLVTGMAQPRLDQRDDATFPRVHLGSYVFDGKGGVVVFVIENQGGHLMRADGVEGTYTVDAGRCVATVRFPMAVFEIILTRDGREGDAIRTDGPEGRVVISARHFKRRSLGHHRQCSLESLSGEYLINGPARARLDQRGDPTFPRINVGSWDFDGRGNILAFAVQNHGGQLIRVDDVEGTYTVDASRCVATVTFGTTIWEIILAGHGEGDGIRTDGPEGQVTVATRHLRRR